MSQSETTLPETAALSLDPVARAPVGGHSGLDAQRLGQATSRRGLRGGQPVLDAARTAYLSTQWSGEHDRRPEPGLLRRTRV